MLPAVRHARPCRYAADSIRDRRRCFAKPGNPHRCREWKSSPECPGIRPAGRRRFTREAACSFPAGKSPEHSAPGRGCAYSFFRACASLLVSPGCSTRNQRSPKRLRHKRPMQKPLKKVFILLRPDPHRPTGRFALFTGIAQEKQSTAGQNRQAGQARQGGRASTGYRRSAER